MSTKKKNDKTVSRRGTIIQLAQKGGWTVPNLAKKLSQMNKDWDEGKNKAAIRGTLADLRKSKKWIVETDKEGKFSLSAQ
jgi:hypothetical protein